MFLIRKLGLRWFLFRSWYELKRKFGFLESLHSIVSFKSVDFSETISESNLEILFNEKFRFFFFLNQKQELLLKTKHLQKYYRYSVLKEDIEKAEAGKMRYFSFLEKEIGFPPNWHKSPLNGRSITKEKHWSQLPDFGDAGDIKFIWEPSRFSIAFKLVRLYQMENKDHYAKLFWCLVENWLKNNPPLLGANWKCGQEIALRVMAWSFGLFGLLESTESTSGRLRNLLNAITISASRIENNISYALSQKNNHGISEAAGLYTVGLLFPYLPKAKRWYQKGKRLLIREGLRQIYKDGSYIQHSMNYHRVMLHNYLWAIRLGQRNNDKFPNELLSRLRKALEFIYQMMDRETGRVPNYGANDGALILPLNTCDYLDYRPVIQAMSVLLNQKRLFPPGPWDEDLLWLFGSEALELPITEKKQCSSEFADGGYYTLRGNQSWGMIRCHTYKDRPSQADMLHFDLWYNGENILRDTGTYQYYCDEPWQSFFKSTAAHNTVEVNQENQMEKGRRFLWFYWTESKTRHFRQLRKINGEYWEGEHYGYCREKQGIIHRRAVIRANNNWVIVDDILGSGKHAAVLRWHLADLEWQDDTRGVFTSKYSEVKISVCVPPKTETQLLRGQKEPSLEGWESLYYAVRSPIPVIKCQVGNMSLPIRFVTALSFGNSQQVFVDTQKIYFETDGLCLSLNEPQCQSDRILAEL